MGKELMVKLTEIEKFPEKVPVTYINGFMQLLPVRVVTENNYYYFNNYAIRIIK